MLTTLALSFWIGQQQSAPYSKYEDLTLARELIAYVEGRQFFRGGLEIERLDSKVVLSRWTPAFGKEDIAELDVSSQSRKFSWRIFPPPTASAKMIVLDKLVGSIVSRAVGQASRPTRVSLQINPVFEDAKGGEESFEGVSRLRFVEVLVSDSREFDSSVILWFNKSGDLLRTLRGTPLSASFLVSSTQKRS